MAGVNFNGISHSANDLGGHVIGISAKLRVDHYILTVAVDRFDLESPACIGRIQTHRNGQVFISFGVRIGSLDEGTRDDFRD